jgi:hypothetical protein
MVTYFNYGLPVNLLFERFWEQSQDLFIAGAIFFMEEGEVLLHGMWKIL